MARMGYKGTGGLGAHENGIDEPPEVTLRPQSKRVGYRGSNTGNKGFITAGSNNSISVVMGTGATTAVNTGGMFLAERHRVALIKLNRQERMLFSTRLRGMGRWRMFCWRTNSRSQRS
jgi:hypothetical protein